jgi:UDP-N-acetylmuramoyl-tripeptide--D-alanyl-D-alanine ligase
MKSIKSKILFKIARAIVKKYHPDVIGIINSHGGSSTREAIFSVLAQKFKTRENLGIFGNEIEIPLTIIGYENKKISSFEWFKVVRQGLSLLVKKQNDYPDIVIMDLKITSRDEVDFIAKYIPFRIGVVGFSDLIYETSSLNTKKIIEIQQCLIRNLSDAGVAILNQDNKDILSTRLKAQKITFGFDESADTYASEPVYNSSVNLGKEDVAGTNFKLHYKGSVAPIFIPNGFGIYHVYSALVAINIGLIYQMNLSEISHNLMNYNIPAGRMRLIAGIKKTIILDDTYSSFPATAKIAIKVLSEVFSPEKSKKFAILGDIAGLGINTEITHREIGHYVAENGIDKLVTIGEMAKEIASAAKEAGMSEKSIFSFTDIKSANKFIQDKIKENDVVLVKGSAVMRMEKVVKEIMAEPLKAKQLLVKRKEDLTK